MGGLFWRDLRRYLKELQPELGDEQEHYSKLFKSADEISSEIDAIQSAIFHYDTANAEIFSQQVPTPIQVLPAIQGFLQAPN